MAWPALTTSETLSGAGAKTVGASIHLRQHATSLRYTTWYFVEYTVTVPYAAAHTLVYRVPPWMLTGAVISVTVLLKATSGTITLRLDETDTATSGTETAHVPTTSYGPFTQTLSVPDDTWAGTLKTLELQAKFAGGGAFATGEYLIGNLKFAGV
jgi:hypothetical protein